MIFFYILVIPDDEYDTGHSDDSHYYQDFIVDHTRIIGGSIVSMIMISNQMVEACRRIGFNTQIILLNNTPCFNGYTMPN